MKECNEIEAIALPLGGSPSLLTTEQINSCQAYDFIILRTNFKFLERTLYIIFGNV